MPSFHTKTIETILEPVAQQVSKLIVLHDQVEDGSAMPSLHCHVDVVKRAVDNLIKVGMETMKSSSDDIVHQDVPNSLRRIEEAALALQLAADLIRDDAFSIPGRRKLTEGSRGILQGTSSLLCTFDLSEVRKIIGHCKSVLDVLAVVEVVDTMEHLVEFVKSLSPCLSRMTKEVDTRMHDLTHQNHRDLLIRYLDRVKALTPVLISSIKMFVTTIDHGRLGVPESEANRDFVSRQMAVCIHEVIRVLQLTSDRDSDWQEDDLARMRSGRAGVDSRVALAHDWFADPQGLLGNAGERALRQLLAEAHKLAQLSHHSSQQQAIDRLAGELGALADALAELRLRQEMYTPAAVSLVRSCQSKLSDLIRLCRDSVTQAERSGTTFRPARTIRGKLSQAQRWLANPRGTDRTVGMAACRALVQEGRRCLEDRSWCGVGGSMSPGAGQQLSRVCDDVLVLTARLEDLTGAGDLPSLTSETQRSSVELLRSLVVLYERLHMCLVERAGEELVDLQSPLRAMLDAANAPADMPGREGTFEISAEAFQAHSERLCHAAELAACVAEDPRRSDLLRSAASEIFGLGGQLRYAARLLLDIGPNVAAGAASDHLDLMTSQWSDSVDRMRHLVDEVTDTAAFIQAQEAGILRDTDRTEVSIRQVSGRGVVEHTTCIARRANRVLQVATLEADNSEDTKYVDQVNMAVKQLRATVTPMVLDAKGLVINLRDSGAIDRWRASNRILIGAVSGVRLAVGPRPSLNSPTSPPSPLVCRPLRFRFPSGGRVPASPSPTSSSSVTWTPSRHNSTNSASLSSPGLVQEMSQLMMEAPSNHRRPPTYQPLRFEDPPPKALWQDGYPDQGIVSPKEVRRRLGPQNSVDEDGEDEFNFPAPQGDDQPIMRAAHLLHNEAQQWSSKDNQLIAAAKRVALLMAKLSQIVRGEWGTKKDLIDIARSIADASDGVTGCAKELARDCTDKRMKTNLLQSCERIPTIATQLNILSTVKATMIGSQESLVDEEAEASTIIEDGKQEKRTDEEMEATEMIVGNAENLMQSVVDTVHAAVASSIKIRVDSGVQIKWTRHTPWFQTQ